MRLLLFDIDGTLLRVTSGAQTAVRRAVASVTGQSASTEGVSFAGRTDPAIFRDVLRLNGLPTDDGLLAEVIRAYVQAARDTIQSANVAPLPGADRLLHLLAQRDDVYLGLVTGNVEPVAVHKLRAAGLADVFSVGGFGSDHERRDKLPALARRRAADRAGQEFSRAETIVIGDTPHDVECARQAGVHSVAVSTGRPPHAELAECNPALLVDSLDDPEAFMQRMLDISSNLPRPSKSRHDL
jgi:phosphoglycolate phosphatase-like HAD superfamily hydrolase